MLKKEQKLLIFSALFLFLDSLVSTRYIFFIRNNNYNMAEYYGASEKYDELCEWYDGYRFGKTEIFNQGSIMWR